MHDAAPSTNGDFWGTMVSMSGTNIDEGTDGSEPEHEDRYEPESARMNVDLAQSKWESMVESGEIQLADPNAALDWPIPTLKLPDGVTSDSILDDLRGDH